MSARPPAPLPTSALGWLPFLWGRVLFSGPADLRTAVRPLSLALVVLLPAALLFPARGFLLLEPDEGRYAQIAKEMLDRGEWVVPTLQGEPYLDKPPLLYWLVRLSLAAFGVSEASARLVPAVSVELTILAVYLIGRRGVGERGAFWAAVLLAVSPGFVSVARLLLLDGLLTLCVTVSVLCGFEAVRTGRFRRGWWLAAAVASGLGFLTKGPISEILLFPPLLMHAYLSRSIARVRWPWVIAFAGIVAAVNLPWYAAMYRREPGFLWHFFWDHNVLRFLRPFDHLQPVWYYVPILLGGFLPGVVVGIPYVRSLVRGEPGGSTPRSSAGGFWLLAGGWCVFFFSCSGSKLPTYILPAFPPLCLALGQYLAQSRWDRSWVTTGTLTAFALLVAALHWVGVPWYARERSPVGRPELVLPSLADPAVTVVTYPRHCDSVAFYTGRNDLHAVRTKDVNQFVVDCHFRPKTVVLFTHDHSLAAFRDAIPSTLRVTQAVSLRRPTGKRSLADKLIGGTPWGLCDVAVVEPVGGPHPGRSEPRKGVVVHPDHRQEELEDQDDDHDGHPEIHQPPGQRHK